MGANRFDVIIVGGGPAGSSCAINLKRGNPNLRVLILDKSAFPRDKVCGDGVGPHAIAELSAIACDDIVADYPEITSASMVAPSGRKVTKELDHPGTVIPRIVLDTRLFNRAIELGTDFENRRIDSLQITDSGCIVNGTFHAELVVAADGANSYTRRLLGIPFAKGRHMAIAARAYCAADTDEFLLAWQTDPKGPFGYSWIFPFYDGNANVGFGCFGSDLKGDRPPREKLVEEMEKQIPFKFDAKEVRAHRLPLSTARPTPYTDRVLFVGDAANFVNPISGEGIYYAFASGRLAATAILGSAGAMQAGPEYQSLVEEEFGKHFRTTSLLARALRNTFVLEAGFRAAENPRVMDSITEITLGKGSLSLRSYVRSLRYLPSAFQFRS